MGSESPISRETLSEKKKKRKKKEKHSEIEMEEEKEKAPPAPPPVRAQVDAISERPGKAPPLVGYFPSGFDPLKVGDEASSTRVRVFRNTTRTNRMQLVVSPSGSQMEFVGSSYSGEATAGQVCTYALGVLDKETQTLKVVPIAANKIFRLEPRGGRFGSQLADKEHLDLIEGETDAEKKAATMRNLTNLYGTKKAISKAKKAQLLHKKEDPETQAHLDEKMKEVEINKEALESTEAHVFRNIPPYDSIATTPEEAYPLEKIIQKGDWIYLQDILHKDGKALPDSYPVFVRNRVHKLDDLEDDWEKKETLACIFQFIAHLLKFKDKHSMDGVSSAKDHAIPSILFMKFSSLFPATDSRRLPDDKVDLLISYVLVLTLHADGFRTDPTDIAKDLRMSTVKVRQHLEVLGCTLKNQNNIRYATLPVPLKFPVVRKRRRMG